MPGECPTKRQVSGPSTLSTRSVLYREMAFLSLRPGTYRLRVELSYRGPRGERGMVTSAISTLTVVPR